MKFVNKLKKKLVNKATINFNFTHLANQERVFIKKFNQKIFKLNNFYFLFLNYL